MDAEGSPLPGRCGSSLSVVKITPATRSRRGIFPFITHKFSDPEIEALYHLHSSNRKRMELFRIFLYALLLYAITQILVHACWVVHRNSPFPPHPLPKIGKLDHDPKSTRMMSPHAFLNPHDVRHEFDTSKIGSTDEHHHQHHPNALQNIPQHFRTFSKDRTSEPRKHKDFPVRLNPSFMSHQHHPAINDSTLPAAANQDYPSNQPFFHKPRTAPVQTNQPPVTHRIKRNSATEDSDADSPDTIYHYDREDSYSHTTRSEESDMIYMVVSFIVLGATLLVTLLILVLPGFCKGNPHLPIIIWTTHILLAIGLRGDEAALPIRLGLGWVLLEIFLIWVTVPLRFKAAFAYNFIITVFHTGFVFWRANRGEGEPFLMSQLVANLLLLLTTNALGILSFYLSDKKQRRAFLDTRQSLEMKLVIEEQAKEQERLLLSVLPEHLALKMRQDLGEAVDGQFKKIYMSRHENVSILYADIVGFTAISSTYSASELVKILNELFARFDRLADKYHQIRIKILGDCYYCICGAPEERTDHGVLCVHMGLSMVKAIKYVRETTNSPVDMRVGIHTGAILAGVLGQRQWQFDVYSKDVELANKMESSGMPGKVHISEATLNFLKDEFEVEPAFGERREEMLRIAGMKTYFITRVLKPFQDGGESKKISENGEQDDLIMKDPPSDLNSTFAEDSTSAIDDNPGCRKDSELESYRLRLKEELISRDGYKDLSKQSQWLTLHFTDKIKEAGFVKHSEPYQGLSSLACPVALVVITICAFLVISFDILGLITSLLVLIILLSISTISAYETSKIKTRLRKASSSLRFLCSLDSKLWVRRLLAVLTILFLTLVNAVFTIPCFGVGVNCGNMTYHYHQTEPKALPNRDRTRSFATAGCKFPAYLIIFCAFSLFSATLLSQPGSWLKSFIILLVILVHGVLINFQPLRNAFDCSEKFSFYGTDLIPETWQLTLFIATIFIVLFTLNRRLEKSTRVLFLWKTEVEEQREHATQLRHKNESLVYNILPPHVATHFLGSRKRKHEELYSHSYSEVGILFASMPNFSDFYTEETVNNQGLECLRFLNEVISDFDALLEHTRFADNIIKIKTIASTYMAASGLNPSKQAQPDHPIMTRWAHLALLVEFALELKVTLTGINEQSFNHFVLKMGINHGPITAGVIGARKPHYDIWGNSVNVASRMESTGKAGCIQVTEETYRILRIFGYQFEQRGLVNVKGKGQLMTYYLTGKGPELSTQEVNDLIEQYQSNLKQSLSRTQSHDHP